tara:strand:- start:6621 stop:6812 length:192 start_codon:yes stop_codon:yes gene_type:complete
MMSDKSNGGGVGFFGLLAVLFIGLKLTNVIAWSWWWVMMPLYGPVVVFCIMGLVVAYIVNQAD